MSERQFRRPARLDPRFAEDIPGDIDPATRSEVAHSTAQLLVGHGRASADPRVHQRLLHLVESEGLDLIAELWSQSRADSLPGALWRLYVVREWIRRDPVTVAQRYELGASRAQVADAVAGVERPPSPAAVCKVADDVLAGVYAGELDIALDRAAALCKVLATGAALDADWLVDDAAAGRLTRRAGSLSQTADDLAMAASLWRRDCLD